MSLVDNFNTCDGTSADEALTEQMIGNLSVFISILIVF